MQIIQTEDSLMKINQTTLNDSDILDIDAKLFNSNYKDSANYKRTPAEVELVTDTAGSGDLEHQDSGIK